MSTDLAKIDDQAHSLVSPDREQAAGALAHVLGTGDLYQLTNEQRVSHYLNLCQSLGLNPLSRPFQWIEFKEGENAPAVLTLYFKPSGAAQMLRNHQISVHFPRKEIVGELFVCEAVGQAPNGRKGSATKYVSLTNRYGKLTGNRLANAFMSAESGALRRLALNMFGLSTGPDPDELAHVREIVVDGTGNVIDQPTEEQKALAADPRMARTIGEPVFEDADVPSEPLAGYADQRPTTEELAPPEKPSGPPPSFKNSEEDINRWCGAWFAAVKGMSLDTDDARHRFVAAWTADEWPKAKRTESLRAAFARMTPQEAGEFLGHVRALMSQERQDLLDQADEVPERGRSGDDVHDAFVLTGASDDPETATAF